MPTICTFYGILIRMFFNDHPPPHFHARYGEFEATVDIGTLEVIEGQLPRRALNLVREWAMMHREELLEDWRFCRENTVPTNIAPLAGTESIFRALGRSRSRTRARLLPLCPI